ncbi:hypothetical protein BAUCODRAFT_127345 [Baudoinia panamericana UAMH 10762]|uniref:G-patch domain-containing protein n=1 Tax=Baudoinia panamericana (strain UAMH 10762) TaxID=717646 RepID=M2MJH7_BAUPA|nr:uncharacterized protein BAUCODRAFT_127345 [Baudoinia panamericana UAMH 10762]EMC91443.1 hypothetical protein BAUCODRAFT_127345 [Baudoinia panamericana UAMH 10762]
MGLGAPKRRNKLSHDPNNTAWSRSSDNFGHRILTSQGWKPGDYLGAEDAAHASHFTAANASHIKVLLREDNLGLGAKIGGKANAETFGLSTLSGIFGRLNGKSVDDVEKHQTQLRDAELRSFQAQKYGFMNFVRGGLLVGDRIENEGGESASVTNATDNDSEVKAVRKDRKRKVDAAEADSEQATSSTKKRKAHNDTYDDHNQTAVEPTSTSSQTPTAGSALDEDCDSAKQRRRAERRARRAANSGDDQAVATQKARLKAEKRARKEDRRRRKEEKRRLRVEQSAIQAKQEPDEAPSQSAVLLSNESLSETPSRLSTPAQQGFAFAGNRHAVRQRYIQQKRMASMDPKALNEILMIKAQG